MTVSLADIQAAQQCIHGMVLKTPCPYSAPLSRLTGCRLYLKMENRQMTGAYKERGALNKVLSLSEERRKAGIIAASAGNHAQGVARAAQTCAIPAVIVMPETTPLAKIQGTQSFGAQVVLYGSSYDEAYTRARELQAQHHYTFIHPFDDPQIIAGQGTIALEILQQVPDVDVLVVPVGGGGLIAGLTSAFKVMRPQVRIIGVEAELMPGMQASLKSGALQTVEARKTLAEGIAVARVGEKPFAIIKDHVDAVVTVTESEIADAIMMLLEREKTVVEGAGAASFAALRKGTVKGLSTETRVVALLSGGNIDMSLLSRIIERGLENDGRLFRLQVVIPDMPGSIAQLTGLIAQVGANVFDLSQSRPLSDVSLGQAEVFLTLETKGRDHADRVKNAIVQAGFRVI